MHSGRFKSRTILLDLNHECFDLEAGKIRCGRWFQRLNVSFALRSHAEGLRLGGDTIRYGGYQVDANLYNRDRGQVYVIDWMTDKGERIQVTVDAKTGRILSSS